jgi:hypothetical protein
VTPGFTSSCTKRTTASALYAGLALILLFGFSPAKTEAATFSPTPEEAALLTKGGQGAKLDLSALTSRTEDGRTFFEIDDMRYPTGTVEVDNAFTGNRWPGGVLYYQFDPAVTATNRVAWRNAAAAWSAVAPVHFTESIGSGNYVLVKNSTGNNSYVGMIGGSQVMNIAAWTYRYVIAHEIGHALGLIHEHSRSNRDAYVTILSANIQSGMQSNFELRSDSVGYGPYDFDSVMHYRRNAFSSNGQNTIQPKPAYSSYLNTMGQTTHLSTQDISGMVQRYSNIGPALNDNFASRITLPSSSGTTNGSNFSATSEAGEPNHAGYPPSASVWYSWTAPINRIIIIDTVGSDFDTVLAVYTGDSVGNLLPVASNDDISTGVILQSRVAFPTSTGLTYRIAVDGYNGSTGHIVLHWGRAAAADFDLNGVTDILFQNSSTGQRMAWLMDETGSSSSSNLPSATTEWNIVGTGDFNGDDQLPDIVFQNSATRQVVVWYMEGTFRTGSANLPSCPANWSVAAIGDFDGDVWPDLVLENVVTGQRAIWLMRGTSHTGSVSLPATATEWKIVGTGDFNGDDKVDIVLQNYSTGRVAVWFMDGTTFQSSSYLPTAPAQWRIAGSGDFNRDHKRDLILQNISTGQRALWLMNGVTLTNGVYLPSMAVQWDIRNR